MSPRQTDHSDEGEVPASADELAKAGLDTPPEAPAPNPIENYEPPRSEGDDKPRTPPGG